MNEIVLCRVERRPSRYLLLAAVLQVAVGAQSPAAAEETVFADGFECCDAASWSSTTSAAGCAAVPTCSTPGPGDSCLSGRLFDAEGGRPVVADAPSSSECTTVDDGGPCALELVVTDALVFLSDPTTAPPLPPDETTVDRCGWYRLAGFVAPPSGTAAVSVDDASGTPDAHALAAGFVPIGAGEKIDGRRLHAVTRAADEGWTDSAGSPFGADTFASRGAILLVFLHGDAPVAGVTAEAQGSVDEDSDFYFSDVEPRHRTTVDAVLGATGANGSALVADNALVERGGSGASPVGCAWPATNLGSAPGVVAVHELHAIVDGQPGQECP